MSVRSILRNGSSVFLITGGLVLCGCAFLLIQAHVFQARESRRFASATANETPVGQSSRPQEPAIVEPAVKTGSVLGELEIPRIGVDTVVLQGDDNGTLRLGAGHIPDTAMPDDAEGNVGIAAHRDTFFRPLRFVRAQDIIILKTATGSHRYRVESTQVVEPSDVAVLDKTAQPSLTLVTCYPFYFVGSAPKRFIVRATEIPVDSLAGLPR